MAVRSVEAGEKELVIVVQMSGDNSTGMKFCLSGFVLFCLLEGRIVRKRRNSVILRWNKCSL